MPIPDELDPPLPAGDAGRLADGFAHIMALASVAAATPSARSVGNPLDGRVERAVRRAYDAARATHSAGSPAAYERTPDLSDARGLVATLKVLIGSGTPVAIAYARLDGLRSTSARLEVVAQVAADSVRPDDMVAKWGDDAVVIAFPRSDASVAEAVVERLRESLVLRLQQHGAPPFTASFGVVDSSQGKWLETLLVHSEEAALHASSAGGNRVVIGGWAGVPYARVPTRSTVLAGAAPSI